MKNWNEFVNEICERFEKKFKEDILKENQKWMKETFDWDLTLDEIEKLIDGLMKVPDEREVKI